MDLEWVEGKEWSLNMVKFHCMKFSKINKNNEEKKPHLSKLLEPGLSL